MVKSILSAVALVAALCCVNTPCAAQSQCSYTLYGIEYLSTVSGCVTTVQTYRDANSCAAYFTIYPPYTVISAACTHNAKAWCAGGPKFGWSGMQYTCVNESASVSVPGAWSWFSLALDCDCDDTLYYMSTIRVWYGGGMCYCAGSGCATGANYQQREECL
jgi:hypothetical protein